MTLLSPLALWLFGCAAAVVALYLLKIRRRRQPVPALEFWQNLAGRTQVRSLFQRLKRWLSLLLWLVIVACLVLAVGNPILSFGRIKPRSIIVIIDNSASMQTREDGNAPASRLELARDSARTLITQRPVRDQWLLLEAAHRPRVVQTWTRRQRDALDALDTITPFRGTGSVDDAVRLARDLLVAKQRPTIVVLSDGAGLDIDALRESADDAELVLWPIGQRRDNLGIAHVNVRLHRQQAMHHVLVRVVSSAQETVESAIAFEIDGSTVDVRPFTVAPGGTWEHTLQLDRPEGGLLRLSLDETDALQLDNEAYAVLPPIEPATVWLVSPVDEAFFFEQALLAMQPLVAPAESRTLTADAFDALGPLRPADLPDLVIVNNSALRQLPDAGRFVFINTWPDDLPARAIGKLQQPSMILAEREHPLTRYLNLQPVQLARARKVDLPGRADILARSDAGTPLIFLLNQPDRVALCLAFDVFESDLPFRNTFPMLLRNAVAHLPREAGRLIDDQYDIGDAIAPLRPVPDDVTDIAVVSVAGEDLAEQTIPVREGRFVWNETAMSTALRFDVGGRSHYTAVNLTDAAESRIAPLEVDELPQDVLGLSGGLLGTTPWIALAAAALLLVLMEWITYHFRWTE